MRITHICLTQYSDGWSYQENMLAKYHKKMGHDVTVLTSPYHLVKGDLIKDEKTDFLDCNGVRVLRLPLASGGLMGKTPLFQDFYMTLRRLNPDIIFLHGCQFKDSQNIARYKQECPEVKLFVDNHADFSNSATNFFSREILHKKLWKKQAQGLLLYAERFWGVMPARVDFLVDVYNIPREKTDLLIMGADNDLVSQSGNEEAKKETRKSLGLAEDDFVIVTGGKIDMPKKQTLLLMDAVASMDDPKGKLVIFGSFVPELEEEAKKKIEASDRILYVGWVSTEESYQYLAIADLAVFPGRHSVFWEQAAGQGIPLLVKYWEGTTHVNQAGNAVFLKEDSASEIREQLEKLRKDPACYAELLANAKKAQPCFLYEEIAKKAIESPEN